MHTLLRSGLLVQVELMWKVGFCNTGLCWQGTVDSAFSKD